MKVAEIITFGNAKEGNAKEASSPARRQSLNSRRGRARARTGSPLAETGGRVKVPMEQIVSKHLSAEPEGEQAGKASVSQMLAKLLDEGAGAEEKTGGGD